MVECKQHCSGQIIKLPTPSAAFTRDASHMEREAHMGKLNSRGLWSPEEAVEHTNVLELQYLRLRSQDLPFKGGGRRTVQIQKDNTITILPQ